MEQMVNCQTEKESCEGPLTEEELSIAVVRLKCGKSPGMDGIPIDFYRTFWNIPAKDFVEMARVVLREETPSDSQQTGVLLYKQGNRANLSNWRPISLLNTDYKLTAKRLCNRLKHVLSSVIHGSQSCSILGRSISDILTLVRDAIHLCEKM